MPTDALVLLCALLFTGVAWIRFSTALTLLPLFLPTYLIRFSVGGIPLNLLDVLIGVLVVVWVLKRLRHQRQLLTVPWIWHILLLLVCVSVSVYVAPDRQGALGFARAFFIEPILVFVMIWDVCTSERHLRSLLFSFGASAALLSLVALLQYLGLLASPEPWVSEVPPRVSSVFDFPNAVGLYLTPIIGLFAGWALLPEAKQRRTTSLFFWGVLLLSFLALMFAVSRGAILAVLVTLMLVALLGRYRRWALIGGAVVALIVIALPLTREMVVDVVRGTDVSTDVRTVLWQGTARLLEDRPIVGAGLGGFQTLYDQYRLIKHVELLAYPHNILLNFWVELGAAGVIIIGWLLVNVFRWAVRLLRQTSLPFVKHLSVGVIAALVALILHGIVDVPYFKNDLAVQFWILVAFIPTAQRLANGQNKNPSS